MKRRRQPTWRGSPTKKCSKKMIRRKCWIETDNPVDWIVQMRESHNGRIEPWKFAAKQLQSIVRNRIERSETGETGKGKSEQSKNQIE